jgi:hypothetical protein
VPNVLEEKPGTSGIVSYYVNTPSTAKLSEHQSEDYPMRRTTIALAWLVFVVVASALASNAETSNPPATPNPCHQHQDQASCAADHACQWSATKNRCHRAHPSNQ